MQTSRSKILARIRRQGKGYAFSAKDFTKIANRGMIDVTFAALLKDGTIRRVLRGLYDFPKRNPLLGGQLKPDIDESARALARRHRWQIVPDGAWAANLLGLSTQVPAKIIYLTDGPNKEVVIGRRTIRFKHARPNALAGLNGRLALAIQALRYYGKDRIGETEISWLRSSLSATEKKKLLKHTRFAADWIYEVAKKIIGKSK